MDDVQVNPRWNCIEDECAEQSLSPEHSGISDSFRDPELLPRVGYEYQVEIPPLMIKSAYLLQTGSSTDTMGDSNSHEFLVGLPILVMMIKEEVENVKHEPQEFPGGFADMPSGKNSEGTGEKQVFPGIDLKAKYFQKMADLSSGNESKFSDRIGERQVFPEGDLNAKAFTKRADLSGGNESKMSESIGEGKVFSEDDLNTKAFTEKVDLSSGNESKFYGSIGERQAVLGGGLNAEVPLKLSDISGGNESLISEGTEKRQAFPQGDLKDKIFQRMAESKIPESIGEMRAFPEGNLKIEHSPKMANKSSGNETKSSESIDVMQVSPKGDVKVKIELMNETDGALKVGESAKSFSQEAIGNKIQYLHGGTGYRMVPGSQGNSWSSLEEASFLLGLYVFGKNLALVQKFVETKNMGDILSFYYGEFYRSDRYHRWSECQKMRSRKFVYGQRIFTGSRQQELLSRLLPTVSEECQHNLLKVVKTFEEGILTLVDFVFTLKATVGLNALVEAVGIGKGKQDLTGGSMEPVKSNHAASVLPEIPSGKACSNLTPLEITNFLTGGYRLSKARSNDLFWEAVWPRLLARGWHSEQPNDHGFPATSRHSLVFLIPGIKKFSRRKLVKGNHYFDSVSDVLNKVASDPTLLELDGAADGGDSNIEESELNSQRNLDQGDFPQKERRCYLKPRTPSHSSSVMRFTIVDTSLANGGTTKVRELRSLPVEMLKVSTFKNDSEDSDEDSSEETEESFYADKVSCDGNKTDTTKFTGNNFDKGVSPYLEDYENKAVKQIFPINGSHSAKAPVNIPKCLKANKYYDAQSRNPIKGRAVRTTKPGKRNPVAPVARQQCRRQIEASCRQTCVVLGVTSTPHEIGHTVGNPANFENNVLSRMDPPREKLPSTSSSAMCSPNISDSSAVFSSNSSAVFSSNSSSVEHSQKTPQMRAMIDLNMPISQDAEIETLMMDMAERRHDEKSSQMEDAGTENTSKSVSDSVPEQPSIMNSRRQSTRNRPLTTKALEALAYGYLTVKQQKRKSRDDFIFDCPMPRPSRRARSRVKATENLSAGAMEYIEDGIRENGMCENNVDPVSEAQV